jgi:hypothetical protein
MKFIAIVKNKIILTLAVSLILAGTLPASASFYGGGDWGGGNLTLLDGDSLSGTFSNVGLFYIPTGAVISGSSDNLSINAGTIRIDGSLSGLPSPGYDLKLTSLADLILSGSIASWNYTQLAANSIILSNGSSISGVGGATSSITLLGSTSGTVLLGGGNSSVTISVGSGAGSGYLPPSDAILISAPTQLALGGGSVSITSTPIPAAAWLFCSGILGLAEIRRRQSSQAAL